MSGHHERDRRDETLLERIDRIGTRSSMHSQRVHASARWQRPTQAALARLKAGEERPCSACLATMTTRTSQGDVTTHGTKATASQAAADAEIVKARA